MTAKELFNEALELAGFGDSEVFKASDFDERMLRIVNAVYAEIFFIGNKDRFSKLDLADEKLNLGEKELYDCAVYGVAALIQNIMGTKEDYEVFEKIYKGKLQELKVKCEMKSVTDTFLKEVSADE